MAKIISISDSVYDELKKLKGDESFSTIIKKLLKKKTNKKKILEFYGKGGVDKKLVKEIDWKSWSERYV